MNKSEIINYIEQSHRLPKINKEITNMISILQTSDKIDIDNLVDEISKWSTLKFSLLQMINSGYFKIPKKVDSLKESIMYLGTTTLYRLVLSYLIKCLLPDNLGRSDSIDRLKYLKHCLGTSIAATAIADKLALKDKYKYFAYGLVHDIGNAVLDICLPGIINEVVKIELRGVHQIVAERTVMEGCTHCDIGNWLSKKWNFPKDVEAVITYHHTPLLATEYIEEVNVMSVADSISTLYYEKLLCLNTFYVLNKTVTDSLGLTMKDIEEISKELPAKVDEVLKMLDNSIFKAKMAI
ncbi:metal dependent phosphohydrolase [Clostridium pasteurianum DSM 525 = ATCC 6013]|uniref:Metal dependent phosphohydrolase n=1 Tax=Clostridium pasteurianum DSM 525 = ATCC 6013 TaxID=1262449 RepID=A0A0H3IZ88_CLOPA|nr:HDOD domain-containing protein [Clostridium pasteurianum]AJA46349.1 metal dependent phosphohydrolase [Clostridium pasteurianum DSM 525 = ATCC 6013]AJA50337.1 metal dependent phosphohydrolase [Clostridium pasteurianum DSM 525 = ATCC 6013]AOZ73789.1 metal-dependent phosphohydrolase [Clostridium pasteurianum DSM 525 = ATCC 6013]AOZ77586.1 metal-dependent phosphohydrolase [Clostridium pasteurianum]ELP60926.1 metal dependent phosphohydrolase [Clostridium pasteurianum DSM 525 = ATCC 6013]